MKENSVSYFVDLTTWWLIRLSVMTKMTLRAI